jgi:hypothetical protein
MGLQMNPDQLTGLFNNDPGGSIGYRENSVTGFDPLVADILNDLIDPVFFQNIELSWFAGFQKFP